MVNSLFTYAIYAVSAMFLLGMAGSAAVVVISFVEDFFELFSDNEIEPLRTHPPTD